VGLDVTQTTLQFERKVFISLALEDDGSLDVVDETATTDTATNSTNTTTNSTDVTEGDLTDAATDELAAEDTLLDAALDGSTSGDETAADTTTEEEVEEDKEIPLEIIESLPEETKEALLELGGGKITESLAEVIYIEGISEVYEPVVQTPPARTRTPTVSTDSGEDEEPAEVFVPPPPPKPRINKISPSGEVKVKFNQNMDGMEKLDESELKKEKWMRDPNNPDIIVKKPAIEVNAQS